MQLSELRAWIDGQQTSIETELRDLVNINTYSDNLSGVDEGMASLKRLAENFGFTVETVNERHLLIKAGNGQSKPRVMLVTHMDTVFPPDGKFLSYEPLENGFVRGPGVGDIKGGTLIGLWSMVAISKMVTDFDIQMIVSANEEQGSPTIRDWYIGGHIGADFAIALEPGFPQGPLTPEVQLGVVYQRRGYAAINYTVKGKSCHSGTPHLGLNAIEGIAQRIVRLHALNDPANGISVNCGMVNGGISPNTVPGEVKGTVSWRYERLADGQKLLQQIEAILEDTYVTNEDLGISDSCDYTLDAYIPPMERTDANMRLIDVVIAEAQRLGQNCVPIARGGGSDANFTSASGTPSICGMGAPAEGIHTDSEMIYLPGVFDRIELLTSTLYRLVNGALN